MYFGEEPAFPFGWSVVPRGETRNESGVNSEVKEFCARHRTEFGLSFQGCGESSLKHRSDVMGFRSHHRRTSGFERLGECTGIQELDWS